MSMFIQTGVCVQWKATSSYASSSSSAMPSQRSRNIWYEDVNVDVISQAECGIRELPGIDRAKDAIYMGVDVRGYDKGSTRCGRGRCKGRLTKCSANPGR